MWLSSMLIPVRIWSEKDCHSPPAKPWLREGWPQLRGLPSHLLSGNAFLQAVRGLSAVCALGKEMTHTTGGNLSPCQRIPSWHLWWPIARQGKSIYPPFSQAEASKKKSLEMKWLELKTVQSRVQSLTMHSGGFKLKRHKNVGQVLCYYDAFLMLEIRSSSPQIKNQTQIETLRWCVNVSEDVKTPSKDNDVTKSSTHFQGISWRLLWSLYLSLTWCKSSVRHTSPPWVPTQLLAPIGHPARKRTGHKQSLMDLIRNKIVSASSCRMPRISAHWNLVSWTWQRCLADKSWHLPRTELRLAWQMVSPTPTKLTAVESKIPVGSLWTKRLLCPRMIQFDIQC